MLIPKSIPPICGTTGSGTIGVLITDSTAGIFGIATGSIVGISATGALVGAAITFPFASNCIPPICGTAGSGTVGVLITGSTTGILGIATGSIVGVDTVEPPNISNVWDGCCVTTFGIWLISLFILSSPFSSFISFSSVFVEFRSLSISSSVFLTVNLSLIILFNISFWSFELFNLRSDLACLSDILLSKRASCTSSDKFNNLILFATEDWLLPNLVAKFSWVI